MDSMVALTAAPSASIAIAPAVATLVAQASSATQTSTIAAAPPAAVPASIAPPPHASTPITSCAIYIEFTSSDITKRGADGRNRARVDGLWSTLVVLAEPVPEEKSAKEFVCHDFPCDGHDQAPRHRVNLDALAVVLALDTAVAAVFPVQS
jgi:hypothetical protein